MKILDEKGKLFGIINIIDLAIILILALAIIFGAKRYFTKPDEADLMKDAKVTFEISDVRKITVDNIEVGHELYWADRNVSIGEITEVNHIPLTKPLELNGQWVNMPVPDKYEVIFSINAKVKDGGDAYWLNGEQVRIGVQYMVKTKYMNMETHIIGLDIND